MIGSSALIVLAVLYERVGGRPAVRLPHPGCVSTGWLGPGRPTWSAVRKVLSEKGPILAFCIALTTVAFVAKMF